MTDETTTAIEPAAAEPVAEPKNETAEATPRGAIDRAFDTVFREEPSAPVDVTEPEGQPRDEQGRFAPQKAAETPEPAVVPKAEPAPYDGPSRFSADAKAVWANVPDPVKAEIKRAFGEMESGIQKYQADFEPLKPFMELAAKNNTTVAQALSNYVNFENELRRNPDQGLARLFQTIGMNPREWAARIMGQQPAPQDTLVRELRNEIATLQKQVSGVTSTIASQNEAAVNREIDAFAAANPRFDELADDIALLIQMGRASDLASAYREAERLNPAPTVPEPPKPDHAAQTRKASMTVTGAPSAGSNPVSRKPPATARAAIDNAFASLGIG